jgi:hypothetical protein
LCPALSYQSISSIRQITKSQRSNMKAINDGSANVH